MKLKPSREIEVYVSQRGFATVVQRASDTYYEEDQIVQLNPEQAQLVAHALLALVKAKSEWWSPLESEKADAEHTAETTT